MRSKGQFGATDNVRDQFDAVAYTNNDGSVNWSAGWVETDPAGAPGPVGDYVGVAAGRLRIHWAFVNDETATRSVDLTGATNATFSFDYESNQLCIIYNCLLRIVIWDDTYFLWSFRSLETKGAYEI